MLRKTMMGIVAAGLTAGLPMAALADVNTGVADWSKGDYAGAVREWQGPADKGDPVAQYNLGQAYKWGKGVPQDLAKAELLFAKAAAQGHSAAADNYGLLLFQRGQHAQAMPYIKTAADHGEPRAPVSDYTTQAPSTPVAIGAPPPRAPARPEPRPEPRARPAIAGTGGWKLQLGAFAVAGNADALWGKLRALPEIAGHPRVNAPTGRVTRLMAGGYSEEGAKAACHKLTAAGYTCLPARD